MPDEPVQIVLDNTLAADDANQIRSLLADQYSGLEVLSSATTSVLQADLFQILPVAAAVVATVNLALTVFRQAHDYSKDRKTDIASFKLSLETELAKMGLVDGKIHSIDNFASIIDGGRSSCKVTVTFEKASRTVELLVRKNGKQLIFSLNKIQ